MSESLKLLKITYATRELPQVVVIPGSQKYLYTCPPGIHTLTSVQRCCGHTASLTGLDAFIKNKYQAAFQQLVRWKTEEKLK